ncbi:aspartic proteinase 36-like isoform X2 [Malus domestica]
MTDNSSTAGLLPCSDRRCKHCSDDSNQCEYNIPYTGGAETTGYFVSDEFSFDMIPVHSQVAHGSSTPIIFGCATTVSGLLARTEVSLNGVLGLSQGPLSVISQLSSRGITPSVFSHCLKGDGNGGGILVLGEILEPSIVYTPLVPKKSYYAINLESIAVNGQILPIDPATFRTSDERATLVDTGTTLAFFVEEAYEPLVHAITSASNFVSDHFRRVAMLSDLHQFGKVISFGHTQLCSWCVNDFETTRLPAIFRISCWCCYVVLRFQESSWGKPRLDSVRRSYSKG